MKKSASVSYLARPIVYVQKKVVPRWCMTRAGRKEQMVEGAKKERSFGTKWHTFLAEDFVFNTNP
jgi:hypothetical protein